MALTVRQDDGSLTCTLGAGSSENHGGVATTFAEETVMPMEPVDGTAPGDGHHGQTSSRAKPQCVDDTEGRKGSLAQGQAR